MPSDTFASVHVYAPLRFRPGLACKRPIDCVLGAIGIMLLMPVMVLIAAAIRLDSKGPVFYRQTRTGLGGRPFEMWKFRTMRPSEGGFVQARRNDPRVTRVGRFLRCSSLDELPQLINVLAGQMSLAGPRPQPLALDAAFRDRVDRYDDRFRMRPGMTGLAQLHGFRGETDTLEKMRARIALDNTYIDRWTLWRDLGILFRTPFFVMVQKNAY